MIARNLRHEEIDTGEVRLHVVRAGSGTPVLLLHGFPEFWYSWRHQIAPLVDAGFTAIAPDLRGYNLSEKPEGIRPYALSRLVEDVGALARVCRSRAGVERVHVVGHDWGGVIAWAFAAEYPELLDRLVILNAPHPRRYLERVRRPRQLAMSWYVLFFQLPMLPELGIRANGFAALRRLLRTNPTRPGAFTAAEIERYVAAASQPGALRAMINYYRATRVWGELEHARAGRVDAETLVIWGEEDSALETGLLEGLEEVAPRVRIERLPGVGHWVQNEAPEEVNRILLDFLR